MREIAKKLAKLINVKTIVTFALVGVFCSLSVTEKIDSQNVTTIVSTVIAFYFGTQHEKGGNDGAQSQ